MGRRKEGFEGGELEEVEVEITGGGGGFGTLTFWWRFER